MNINGDWHTDLNTLEKFSRDMSPDLACRPAKLRLQPRAEPGLLIRSHARPPALPSVKRQNLPAVPFVNLEPAPDRIVVEIEKLRDLRTTLAIIEQ